MLYIIIPALVASYLVFTSWYSCFRHAANARRLNCQPAHSFKDRLHWGIDFVRRIAKADRNERLCEELSSIFEEEHCSTFQFWFIFKREFWTAEPKNLQAILATQFSDFAIPWFRGENMMPMFGVGIFTSNGKTWEHSRAMIKPQFTRQQISDLDLEERHLQEMMLHLKPNKDDASSGWTGPVDLKPMFFRLTIDTTTEFFFGKSVHSQIEALSAHGLEKTGKTYSTYSWGSLADHFDNGTNHMGLRARLNEFYWLHSPRSLKESSRKIVEFADHFVQEALRLTDPGNQYSNQERKEENNSENIQYTFLYELIKETRDPIQLRSGLLHMLLAGRDSTAGLLSWVFILLARHPDVYQKLRTVVLETFGSYESPQNLGFAQLKGCSYLQYVMQETLRLYPVTPVNNRIAVTDTTLPVGGGTDGTSPIYVKKGELINYSVYVMHRRKDIWGPDADEYMPERWANRKSGWEYLPFNGGPRVCLGQQFALTEAGYVIVRLVQMFDKVEAVDPTERVVNQVQLTSTAKKVLVNMHRAG